MKYLFDTNVCICILKGNSPSVLKRLSTIDDEAYCISSIVKFELLYGALKSKRSIENTAKLGKFLNCLIILPFDEKTAVKAAEIRASLELTGSPIGPMDILIAATVLSNDLILITHNTREFSRVENLRLEDWEE